MKVLIVIAVLTLAAAACVCAVCVDLLTVHECIQRCGPDTILLARNCSGLYVTGCFIQCTRIEELVKEGLVKEGSCVDICKLNEILTSSC